MNTQPEALRLADLLETYPLNECDEEAAAELRRQHAELEATERQVEILSDELSRCSKLNREVLEALKEIVDAADGDGWNQLDASFSKARAAIAKATGEQK